MLTVGDIGPLALLTCVVGDRQVPYVSIRRIRYEQTEVGLRLRCAIEIRKTLIVTVAFGVDEGIPAGTIDATHNNRVFFARSRRGFSGRPKNEPPSSRAGGKALGRANLRALRTSFMQSYLYFFWRRSHEAADAYQLRPLSNKALGKHFTGRRPA